MFWTGLLILPLLICVVPAAAAVPEWGQCGGSGYSGDTECASGLVCVRLNDWYSQCQPSTSPPTTTTTPPPTTSTTSTTTNTSPTTVPSGFVKASGTKFTLDGKTFVPVGTNSYWVGLGSLNSGDQNTAFADIAAFGATVVRTWGFNEVTSPSQIYYQSWSGSTPTVNTGSDGLQSFDNVLSLAKANGLKLIVALTNNWSDYGGMDVYVKQILNSDNHDYFYTDARVISAFKKYVKTFVSRYANDDGIFAWELANEPRCKGSSGTTSGSCTPATVTAWAKDISAYIKSIDSNHMVAIGDEGFFNQPGNPSYPYQGSEGIDFEANIDISTVDFATFHAYPGHWGESANPIGWGDTWITDHANVMKQANKPVIIEEFGVEDNQSSTYTSWYSTILSSGLTGDLIWQAGSIFSWGSSHDDGYTIYPNDPVYALQRQHAAALKARDQ